MISNSFHDEHEYFNISGLLSASHCTTLFNESFTVFGGQKGSGILDLINRTKNNNRG